MSLIKEYSELYALSNKETGKWFYEKYTEEFQGGSYTRYETDSLETVIENEYIWSSKELADTLCRNDSRRYGINLEVVKIYRVVTYEREN